MGLGGGVLAWFLVLIALLLLYSPVSNLASAYDSDFRLSFLGFFETATVLFGGALLGVLGAWIGVSRHLETIEPTS